MGCSSSKKNNDAVLPYWEYCQGKTREQNDDAEKEWRKRQVAARQALKNSETTTRNEIKKEEEKELKRMAYEQLKDQERIEQERLAKLAEERRLMLLAVEGMMRKNEVLTTRYYNTKYTLWYQHQKWKKEHIAYLGLELSTEMRAASVKLVGEPGVKVNEVKSKKTAAAGIEIGDYITFINGDDTPTADEFRVPCFAMIPGEPVTIKFKRLVDEGPPQKFKTYEVTYVPEVKKKADFVAGVARTNVINLKNPDGNSPQSNSMKNLRMGMEPVPNMETVARGQNSSGGPLTPSRSPRAAAENANN